MKKILLLWLTKNVALSHSFKRLAFLAIALTLSFTASAQNYCLTTLNSVSPNTTYTLKYTCKNVSGTTYQIILDFTNTATSATNINIGSNPGTVNVGTSQTPVWSNSNKTLTFQFVSASNPTLYVATIFVTISGTSVRWDLPTNANFQNPCTSLAAPTLGTFTVPAKVIGDAAFSLTPPTSNSAGAFTYSSNNSAVATISGSTVTVVGAGSATITASQAANGVYGVGSTTATLSVTPPAAPAPPVRNAWDVVSFYSGAYSNSSSPTWDGSTNSDISIGGNTTRFFSSGYTNGQITFAATNLSAMTHLHVDVYSVNLTPMWFYLGAKRINVTTPATGWTTLDIPLSDFTSSPTGAAINLNSINLFKTENPNGVVAPPRIIYLDNIYFYRAATDQPPTIGTLTVASPKTVGDAAFTLTDPISNSSGTWTYSASPAGVVTISGNTVTIVGGGTTTITATQAAVAGVYGSISTTASLVVNFAAPGPSPIPPVRDAADVISLYTGTPTTYANVSTANQASWSAGSTNSNFSFVNGTDTCIQVNNLGYFGLEDATTPNFSVAGMTKLHVDIYVNTPMTTMILNLLAPSDRIYSIGPLATGWNSFDIPLTNYPGVLTDIAGIKFEQSGGDPRQIYIDNVYFYRLPLLAGNIYINDGTFAAGDYCTAAGQDIDANDGTTAKPFATLDYALTRSSQAAGTIFYVDAGTYSWPATHTFTASGTVGNPITIQGKGSTTNITSTTSTNSGLYFTTGSNWVVKDLNWTATNAITVLVSSATGISLENCTFNFTSTSMLQSIVVNNAAGKLTIKNCTLSRSNTAFHMIEILAGAALTLQDNTIRFSANVLVTSATSVKITPSAASVFVIERNKFFGGGYCIEFAGTSAVVANASSIIRNNFIATYIGVINQCLTGSKLYHNSFYTQGECLYAYDTGLTNWDIQNNIFYNFGSDAARACVFMLASTNSPTTLNYNHYYHPSNGANGAFKYAGTVYSLAAWKALTTTAVGIREANGQGGSVTANNPLYTNIASLATNDLHIQSVSPTIGVGSNVGVTDDIDGNARPLGGTYDLGADESVPGTPTITDFPAIAKVMGDAPFTLETPTSNSSGAWTYSITVGNNTVATISAATVTLVAPGTATLRATQAADGIYSSGFIEATLTVTPSPFPLTGPPTPPARNAWDVVSVFSGAYTPVAGTRNYNPNWGQSGYANFAQPVLAGDEVIKYKGVNYQGIEIGSTINTTTAGMTHVHIDIWTATAACSTSEFRIIDGGERSKLLSTPLGQWNSFDIPLTDFVDLNQANIYQFKFQRSPYLVSDSNEWYIDNIYFYRPATTQPPTLGTFTVPAKVIGDAAFSLTPPTTNSNGAFTYSSNNSAVATISGSTVTVVGAGSATITASQAANGVYGVGSTTATLSVTPPAAPAPPARNTWDVISLYSDSYITSSSASWGAGTDVTISGNNTRSLSGSPTYRLGFSATNVSSMTTLHIDVYALNQNSWEFRLNDKAVVVGTPINGWTSVDILLSAYAPLSLDLTNVSFFDFFNPNGASPNSSYLDNIYFYRAATTQPPTLGALTVPSPKVLGDAPFTLTDPTSNSSGAFAYTSSNTAVATVNGNTVTIVGAGSSTITATQAANGVYGTGSTTATLTVTPPAAPVPTRLQANVLSVYSNTYTPAFGTVDWTNANDVTLSGNAAKVATSVNYAQGAYPSTSISGMTHLHIDVYTTTANTSQMKVQLSSVQGPYSTSNGVWTSLDLPLSNWSNPSDSGLINLQGYAGPGTFYFDNIYFYKQDTWLGTTDTAWTTTSNWASGSVPTTTSDVVIASSANQPIIGSDVSISSLTINSGKTLTVNAGFNLTVANAVANSGTMTLQNNANLLQSSAATTNSNTGNIIVKRNSASLLRLDHTLWSSPVASQNLYNFSPLTLTNRFYTYNTTSNGYVTTGLSSTTTFVAGKGYAVRAPNDHSSVTPTPWEGTFTGIPNNGTVPFTLDNNIGFNLVGNPYPSPITATSFLAANSTKIDGTLYFYAHSLSMNADGSFPTGTNYSSWNGSGSVAATTTATTATSPDPHLPPEAPNGIIQVGQGFFVKATAAGTINFTNAMRVANNDNQFFRTTEIERHRLWLNLTTDTGTDINQIAVAYVEGATQNADTNFDGLSFGNTGSMLSSKINGFDYVIQGRSLPFASNDIVPLGFKASAAGNYKIVLTNKDGLFLGNQDVFVRDNVMGIEHNIKVAPYLFASQEGTFDARFQLVYTQTLGTPSSSFTPNSVLVYKNTDGFHVTTNGIVMKDILVYDISGRLIFKQSNINGTSTHLKGLSQTSQVLLLKITSQENETVTVKAIN